MADLREDFVQYVVKALVSNPDAVVLKRQHDDKGDYLELTVDPVDMGKVIGKAGATAKSIRTLLRGVGAKDDLTPLPLKIIDPEGSRPTHEDQAPEPEAAPVEEAPEAEVVAEAPAEPEPEPEPDEHEQLHADTKREMQELADFEV